MKMHGKHTIKFEMKSVFTILYSLTDSIVWSSSDVFFSTLLVPVVKASYKHVPSRRHILCP